MKGLIRFAATIGVAALFAGCGGSQPPIGAPGATSNYVPELERREQAHTLTQSRHARRAVGLGPIVQDAFGGEIYGWDIDQSGSDGLLSETAIENTGLIFLNGIETFDESSGKVTKIVQKTRTNADGPTPVVDAIAGHDVGLIDGQFDFVRNSKLVRDDKYLEMNPVSGNKITGRWKPPDALGLDPNFVTDNQDSSSQAMIAYRGTALGQQGLLYMYDVATNRWQKPYAFSGNQVLSENVQYAAIDTQSNAAVTSYQKYQYPFNQNEVPPTFIVFDARNGKLVRKFRGLGQGYINGMAIDSTTGTMCTTTFGDHKVEFYKVSSGKGFAVQIPILFGGGALSGGAAVAVDQVHHLFIIAQLNSTFSSTGSTVMVYNERGHLFEHIDGFEFLDQDSAVIPHIAVNPTKRLGYANGPNENELQEFTY